MILYDHRTLLAFVPELESKSMLDLGAGYFALDSSLHLASSGQTIALDLCYREQKPLLVKDAVAGDALRLPFRDECIDVVVQGYLADLVHDRNMLFTETARVLKPGGYLVGDVPMRPMREFRERGRLLKLAIDIPSYLGQARTLRREIEKSGLIMVHNGLGVNATNVELYVNYHYIARKGDSVKVSSGHSCHWGEP
ncbi:MAG: class I SAM-dependent methyltransferase [Candidatus Woesearchaeota archaeon]